MIKSFRDLEVYQKAYKSSLEIHKLSLEFPRHEQFELGAQIRRATKSISLNIAEGFGKKESAAEFRRFLKITLGSSDEVKVQLEYCKDLGYFSAETWLEYAEAYEEISKMLQGLIKKWR